MLYLVKTRLEYPKERSRSLRILPISAKKYYGRKTRIYTTKKSSYKVQLTAQLRHVDVVELMGSRPIYIST